MSAAAARLQRIAWTPAATAALLFRKSRRFHHDCRARRSVIRRSSARVFERSPLGSAFSPSQHITEQVEVTRECGLGSRSIEPLEGGAAMALGALIKTTC